MAEASQDETTFMYCIKLPFRCVTIPHTYGVPTYKTYTVVKVGKSDSDPVGRIKEILETFNKFGATVNLSSIIDGGQDFITSARRSSDVISEK